jgi:hypothetical protein
MESIPPKRRFPPPWTVVRDGPDAFTVQDANGISVGYDLLQGRPSPDAMGRLSPAPDIGRSATDRQGRRAAS